MFYQGARYLCLTFMVVLMLTACGASEQAAKYLERGKAYFEEGNYDKARVELKNALQIDPKSVDGHYYLALALERKQNLQEAFSHFLAVLELDPKHIPGRFKVGKYYLLSQRYDKAMEMADSILADEPNNPDGMALRGSVLAHQGDQAGALEEAEKAYQLAPENREVLLLLSSLYQKMKQPDKAEAILAKAIELHPDTAIFRLKLIELYARANDTDALEGLLRESIEHNPRNTLYRTQLAQLYAGQNRLDDAEKVLRDSVAAEPGDEERELLLVRFLREKRGTEAAEAELLEYVNKNPKASKARLGLARLYRDTGKSKQAEQLYLEIMKKDESSPPALQARNELAMLHLSRGESEEAGKLVAEVLAISPRDPQALTMRGRMALRQGEMKKAISDFRTILQDNPASDSTLVLLAEAHVGNNEPELAVESLRKAIKINPQALEARHRLIGLLTRQKRYDDALSETVDLLKVAPDDRRGLLAMVDLNLIKEDWKRAEQAARKIEQDYPEEAIGNLKLGMLYVAQKRYDAALRELKVAAKKAPRQADVIVALVKTYMAKGEPEKAISRLRREIERVPANRAGYYNLLGEIYLSQQRQQQAIDAFRNAVAANKKWLVPARSLANLYLIGGDSGAAIKVAEGVAQASRGDAEAALFLAGVYELSDKFEDAMGAYREVLKIDPDNEVAANNLASLLTDHRGDAASLQQALKLADRFRESSNPAYIDTLGWIYYRSGEHGKALELLKRAVQKAPGAAIFHYHLGMAYRAAGDKALARQHLEAALEGKVNFRGIDEAKEALKGL